MKLRRWGIVVLVLSTVMLARPPAATAFAGTGTISVDGWYHYEHVRYSGGGGSIGLSIYSYLCTDTWAGTTANQSGLAGICEMRLGGGSSFPPPMPNPSISVDGWYQSLGGTPHTFRFVLPGPEPAYPLGIYVPPWNAGVTTGGVTSGPHQGPATMTYHFLPPSSGYGSGPYSDSSYYYFSAWGQITFTVDYVLH